jgi:O-acetyl-ADP-ribose deacetylase (regulator of RNase III)
MKFILTAIDDELADAFECHCADFDGVQIFRGSIFDVSCDAVVSPANSFGFMDGGIDSWYKWRFGDGVQDNVRMAILKYWHGELPVGAAEIVYTNDDEVEFLISAPTMRVPLILGKDSINAYMSMRALIMLVREGIFRDGKYRGEKISDHVKTIALPGLGTGVGKIPYETAAHQISKAISLHAQGKHFLPKSWFLAQENHEDLLKPSGRNIIEGR